MKNKWDYIISLIVGIAVAGAGVLAALFALLGVYVIITSIQSGAKSTIPSAIMASLIAGIIAYGFWLKSREMLKQAKEYHQSASSQTETEKKPQVIRPKEQPVTDRNKDTSKKYKIDDPNKW